MKIEGNDITLEYGNIIFYLDTGDYLTLASIDWDAYFEYSDSSIEEGWRCLTQTFSTLEEAMNWYEEQVKIYVKGGEE